MSSATCTASECSSSVPGRWAKASRSPSSGPVAPTCSSSNRSTERAADLAERIGGVAVGFERLPEAIGAADVIVASTGAEQHILTVDLVQSARSGPISARPLHIIDIAVPRDVEAGVADLAGVTVLDLDDLRDWADRGLCPSCRRGRTCPRHRVGGGRAIRRGDRPPARPLRSSPRCVRQPRESAGTRLQRFDNALNSLDESQRDAVEALTKSIIAKLLHEPSVRLKAQAGTPQGERNAVTMRELFDLG